MFDAIKLKPSEAFLTEEAAHIKYTRDGFGRSANIVGKETKGTIVLKFQVDRYPVVTLVAIRLRDGRWWMKSIRANLPALLRGHNGSPLADERELHLALTRLRHIVALVTIQECHQRLIPGTGSDNHGFIEAVECLVQFHDPDHRFLIGSHFARLKHQQKPTGVYFRQSSKFITREVILSVYDKHAQMRHGVAEPAMSEPTRVEARFFDETRLAKDVRKTSLFTGMPGPLVSTLSSVTARALVQRTLSRLTGFGWHADADSLGSLPKVARLIAASLGPLIHKPHHLDFALENYRRIEQPSSRTMQTVESKLRAFAASSYLQNSNHNMNQSLADLPRAGVRWPERERVFETLMSNIGAPGEPDADIAGAWSQTAFLPAIPDASDLFGSVAPAAPPFRTDTL